MFTDLYHKDTKKTPSALSCFKHFRIFFNLYSEKIKDEVKNNGNCFRFAQRVSLLCRRFLCQRNDKYPQWETSLRIVLREIHGVTTLVRGLEMGDEEKGWWGELEMRNNCFCRGIVIWPTKQEQPCKLGLTNIDSYFCGYNVIKWNKTAHLSANGTYSFFDWKSCSSFEIEIKAPDLQNFL